MAQNIFIHHTSNIVIDNINGNPIRATGRTQVDIAGVLDGADVITYAKGAQDELTIVRTCSWLSADGDELNGSDGGYEFLNNRELVFEIKNAGALTDISLQYDTFGG